MAQNESYSFFENELNEIKQNNQYRFLKTIQSKNDKYVFYNNKKYINLSSNDYLGLATDKESINDFYSGLNQKNLIDSFGLGSASSRLLTGDNLLYNELEKKIADLYSRKQSGENPDTANNKEALVFNSGYHANIGIISTLAGKNDLILSDRLNHASIIDGTRLSRATCIPYEHMDYDHLLAILEKQRNNYGKAMIISESVFSMDGDIVDLKRLLEIKNRFNAILYIDEAHAVGLFGESGLGICEREKAIDNVDIIVGTFGKALASQGAYIVTNSIIKEYLINKMRTLIFTTALPPVIVNWNLYIVNKLSLSSFKEKREKLLKLAERLRGALNAKGIKTNGESQIVPAIIGDKMKTVQKSEDLQKRGFLLFPIRPPTVPQGTSRIRISLTANINWEDIKEIPDILSD